MTTHDIEVAHVLSHSLGGKVAMELGVSGRADQQACSRRPLSISRNHDRIIEVLPSRCEVLWQR